MILFVLQTLGASNATPLPPTPENPIAERDAGDPEPMTPIPISPETHDEALNLSENTKNIESNYGSIQKIMRSIKSVLAYIRNLFWRS